MKPWRVTPLFNGRRRGREVNARRRGGIARVCRAAGVAMVVALLAAGCATGRALSGAAAGETLIFHVLSSVVVRAPAEGAAKRFSIVWKRFLRDEEVHDEVLVKTPLGTTEARLTRSPRQAVLEQQGKKTTTENAAELSQQVLGYALPVDSFGYWLVGASHPFHSTTETIQPGGKIVTIKQNEWQVDYTARDAAGRPQQIKLTSPAAHVEVSVKKWLAP